MLTNHCFTRHYYRATHKVSGYCTFCNFVDFDLVPDSDWGVANLAEFTQNPKIKSKRRNFLIKVNKILLLTCSVTL